MPRTLPEDVREQIRELIYERADSSCYLAQGRTENREFMLGLVNDPNIGGVISDYMPDGEVKTYIKDAVLNRYAKERRATAQKRFPTEQLIETFFGKSHLLSKQGKVVEMYRSAERQDSFCVVGIGTAMKWETALRHALLYAAGLPKETQTKDVQIALRCSSPRGKLTMSDKELIRKALEKIGVVFLCEEF